MTQNYTPNLGQLCSSDARRDAVHIAVAPVVAGERLDPGCHVGIKDGVAILEAPFIGIVDPFFLGEIKKGQIFWLYLYPGTITGLRHVWSHPAFAEAEQGQARYQEDRAYSERWLREYAAKLNCYDTPHNAFVRLMDDLRSGAVHAYGTELSGVHDLDYADELKKHAERYLGISIEWGNFTFSCGC